MAEKAMGAAAEQVSPVHNICNVKQTLLDSNYKEYKIIYFLLCIIEYNHLEFKYVAIKILWSNMAHT